MWKVLRIGCFLTQVCLTLCLATKPYIIFTPPQLSEIEVQTVHRVNWTLLENNTFPKTGVYFVVDYNVLNPRVFNVSSSYYETSCLMKSRKNEEVYSFDVTGKFLGYGTLEMNLKGYNCRTGTRLKAYNATYKYDLSVIRGYFLAKDIFTVALGVAVAVNYVSMGCQLDLKAIWNVLKSPVGPIIGLCCQFIIMPLGSYGFGLLLFDDLSLRLGLFTLGCSPGGSLSNFWTLLFNGDLNLSVTMTFISTIAALGMMPLWFFTLGSKLFHKSNATLPYGKLATSLVTLTGPLVIGLLIRRFKPRWAELSNNMIRPFTIVTMISTILLGIYANQYIFLLFTWQIILAGFAVAASGYLLGTIVAWLCCLSKGQILAVAIETAFQNGGMAYIILTLSLPQPDADLTAVPLVAQLLLTTLPMWVTLIVMKIWSCVDNSKSYSLDEYEKDTEAINAKEIEDKKIVLKY